MTAKTGALVLGVVFVLVGIAGFVPNPLVGPNGIFVTNAMHDYVHIGSGAVLVLAGLTSVRKAGTVARRRDLRRCRGSWICHAGRDAVRPHSRK